MERKREIVQVAFVHIERDGKVFLVQEKGGSWGLWSLPGGHVDPGESPKETVIREAKEESGYAVEIVEKLGEAHVERKAQKNPSDDQPKFVHIHVFRGRPVGEQGEIIAAEDFLDARWVPKDEVAKMPLRGEWVTMGFES